MTLPAMQPMEINGVRLDVWDRGSGEPVVFVHGSMGDECFAVLEEPVLADHYRLIHYHRRGWGNSQDFEAPFTIEQQAADCRAVMQHLGVARAHLAGQSYGGVVSLQMALDYPETVHTLALLEPALIAVMGNSPAFNAVFAKAASLYESGDTTGAVETFGLGVCGDEFRTVFDRNLPVGHFERWSAAADTLFGEGSMLSEWTFTATEAARITQPVLNMTGANAEPFFRDVFDTMEAWLPNAENFILPDATHCMLQLNPQGAAERLASFFSSHRIQNDEA